MHSRPALAHLHLVHLLPEQQHLINSLHAFAASDRVIHTGTHLFPSFFRPQSFGKGIAHWGSDDNDHTLLWKITRLTCWARASYVGGRFSRFLLFLQNSSHLDSLTSWHPLVLSYMTTVNRSKVSKCGESMSMCSNGFSLINKKAFVTSGKAFYASQTLFLPLPLKEEVVSHPEKVWNTGNDCAFFAPISL